METSQRYIVREVTGYPCSPSGRTAGSATPQTDVMVLDRWDCHRVVASFPVSRDPQRKLDQRRLEAKAVASRFEYEHRRWLAEAS